MRLVGGSVHCETGHSFDVARQGYLNLLPGSAHTGTADTAEMVRARAEFLSVGHFDFIADALASAASTGASTGGCVVDLGAGTGYYLARLLDGLLDRSGLALDISKYALRVAARSHPRAGAIACDAWGTLPVRDAVAAVVINVFAPRNGAEIARVLEPGGTLLVVTPTPLHLGELVDHLGLLSVDEDKAARVAEGFAPHLTKVGEEKLERKMLLGHSDIGTLVQMGPSAHHVDAREMTERIATLPEPLPVTASVTISSFRRI
jgi:23S rRNA (guanine745-N1)-methyltransferase